jgi:hypothetical protein
MPLGRAVEVAKRAAPLGARRAPPGVDLDGPHLGQVDDQAAVAERVTGHAVPAPAHGDQQLVVAGEVDRGDHVLRSGTARHQRRAPVDHAVPDLARRVVVRVTWQDQLTSQARSQAVNGPARKIGLPATVTAEMWAMADLLDG